MSSVVKALIDIGISARLSSRLVAVTTTSSIMSPWHWAKALGPVSAADTAAAMALRPYMAAPGSLLSAIAVSPAFAQYYPCVAKAQIVRAPARVGTARRLRQDVVLLAARDTTDRLSHEDRPAPEATRRHRRGPPARRDPRPGGSRLERAGISPAGIRGPPADHVDRAGVHRRPELAADHREKRTGLGSPRARGAAGDAARHREPLPPRRHHHPRDGRAPGRRRAHRPAP